MENKKIKKIFQIKKMSFLNSTDRIAKFKLFNQTLFSYRLPLKKAKLVF